MVAAVAISGRLDFDPVNDTLINQDGEEVKLDPPTGMELPPLGFDVKENGYLFHLKKIWRESAKHLASILM